MTFGVEEVGAGWVGMVRSGKFCVCRENLFSGVALRHFLLSSLFKLLC